MENNNEETQKDIILGTNPEIDEATRLLKLIANDEVNNKLLREKPTSLNKTAEEKEMRKNDETWHNIEPIYLEKNPDGSRKGIKLSDLKNFSSHEKKNKPIWKNPLKFIKWVIFEDREKENN